MKILSWFLSLLLFLCPLQATETNNNHSWGDQLFTLKIGPLLQEKCLACHSEKEGKLKGHTDNVRAIVVDTDGKKCVTASSDRTIRVWDIGEQRCVQTFAGMHTGSIWALACNRDFTRVYSGGIDARICVTSLRDRKSSLVANESAAILKLRLDESTRASGFAAHSSDGDLWTATASRSVLVCTHLCHRRAHRPAVGHELFRTGRGSR